MKLNIMERNMISASQSNRENYKSLRTNIEFSGDYHVIAITSTIPGEGKSTVSLHIAYELALSGKKTVFVDCDLRKSMYNDRFGFSNRKSVGVSNYVTGQMKIDKIINSTDVENLSFVLSGRFPPNPSELIGTPAFGRMLEELRERFDYVIVDTSPVSSVIDAAIIATKCDGIVLVIGSDLVSYRMVERIKNQIERSGCKIIGAVLNKIKITNRTAYGTYGTNRGYYYSYNHYYRGDE